MNIAEAMFYDAYDPSVTAPGLDVAHLFTGGIYCKRVVMAADEVIIQHKHTYSHLSILASGRVELVKGDTIYIIDGPAMLDIEANTNHAITALTDVVWYCIHATDCTDPDAVDGTLIAGGTS